MATRRAKGEELPPSTSAALAHLDDAPLLKHGAASSLALNGGAAGVDYAADLTAPPLASGGRRRGGGGTASTCLRLSAWAVGGLVLLLLVLSWGDTLDYSHKDYVTVEGTQVCSQGWPGGLAALGLLAGAAALVPDPPLVVPAACPGLPALHHRRVQHRQRRPGAHGQNRSQAGGQQRGRVGRRVDGRAGVWAGRHSCCCSCG